MPTIDDHGLLRAREELGWLASTAIRLAGADAGSIGIPEGLDGLVRLGVVAAPGEALEFVRIDASDTHCARVVEGGRVVEAPASSRASGAMRDSFMQASSLQGFLGAPMVDPGGTTLGMMAVMTHETRIWSRGDITDLSSCARLGAHAIAGHACPDPVTVARAIARH